MLYNLLNAALRSLDLSRQVGAAVLDSDGSILTTGCNEVPKHGGGLYWTDEGTPARDFELGYDANVSIKGEILEDIFSHLKRKKWLAASIRGKASKVLVKDALFEGDPFLQDSLMFDVIEFGRAVHAEAAAIAEAARRGVSLNRGRLFCTTFPCHICARHIVASGIDEVVFVEPYEKSRTGELYADSVSIEPQEPSASKVNFRAFVGVAPRRYIDFFQMTGPRKRKDGKILQMEEIAREPRIKRIVLTYLLIEEIVVAGTKVIPTLKKSTRTRRQR